MQLMELPGFQDFYEAMFGFKRCGTEGWRNSPEADQGVGLKNSASTGFMLKGHNCFLELFEFTSPAQAGPPPASLGSHELGVRHLAFYVDDVWQEFERLKALGGIHMNEPVGNDEIGWAVYCRDPFGNIIELAELPSPEEDPRNLPGVESLGEYSG